MSHQAKGIEEVLLHCSAIHIDAQQLFHQPDDNQLVQRLKAIEQNAWELYEILRNRLHELPPTVVVASRRLAYFVVNYRDSNLLQDERRDEAGETPSLVLESDRCIREVEEEFRRSVRSAVVQELTYTFPEGVFPEDVTNIISLTYEEALIDFS